MKSTVTIGRSGSCDIIIPHEKVSREHARISIVGGQYIYEDVSKNGSVIGGRIIQGQRLAVAAGAEILLAGAVPLPWTQIYSMLPLQGVSPYEDDSGCHPHVVGTEIVSVKKDSIGVGWGILAFLIPLAGWIMYFVWKDDSPHKASVASTLAWIGFALNVITSLLTL